MEPSDFIPVIPIICFFIFMIVFVIVKREKRAVPENVKLIYSERLVDWANGLHKMMRADFTVTSKDYEITVKKRVKNG